MIFNNVLWMDTQAQKKVKLVSFHSTWMSWIKETGWVEPIRENNLVNATHQEFGSRKWQCSILRWHDGLCRRWQWMTTKEMTCMCSVSLRYLNASANSLESLPSACAGEESLSVLQLLYLTNNLLTDQCVPVLVGHPRLRILHLANNQLQTFPAR